MEDVTSREVSTDHTSPTTSESRDSNPSSGHPTSGIFHEWEAEKELTLWITAQTTEYTKKSTATPAGENGEHSVTVTETSQYTKQPEDVRTMFKPKVTTDHLDGKDLSTKCTENGDDYSKETVTSDKPHIKTETIDDDRISTIQFSLPDTDFSFTMKLPETYHPEKDHFFTHASTPGTKTSTSDDSESDFPELATKTTLAHAHDEEPATTHPTIPVKIVTETQAAPVGTDSEFTVTKIMSGISMTEGAATETRTALPVKADPEKSNTTKPSFTNDINRYLSTMSPSKSSTKSWNDTTDVEKVPTTISSSNRSAGENIPEPERCHKKHDVRARRYDVKDVGLPHYFKGWVDVQGQGAANDYCRYITRLESKSFRI